MSRLFGSVDSEEMREVKANQLEQRIVQAEVTTKEVHEDLTYVFIVIIRLYLSQWQRDKR